MALTPSDLLQLLRSAAAPVDVFGVLPGEPQAALKRRYRELVAIAHPDRNPANADAANQACIGLQEWHAAAQRQIAQGVYGLAPRIRAATKLHQYLGYAPPLQGDLCELFPAEAAGAASEPACLGRWRTHDGRRWRVGPNHGIQCSGRPADALR